MPHGLNVVLVEPEIPQNTGSIGRLCLATGTTLHLVDPLGFEITHAKLRRAGLDYWEHLKVCRHGSFEEFLKNLPPSAPRVFFSKKAEPTIFNYRFEAGTYLIFGKETAGLPEWVLESYPRQTVKIPMYDARVRSLEFVKYGEYCRLRGNPATWSQLTHLLVGPIGLFAKFFKYR